MSVWNEVLVEWCNCLSISNKIEDFNELRDGDFFAKILYIINKSDGVDNEEGAFKNLVCILNNIYNNAQLECSESSTLSEMSEDDLKIITSLLMHYTCIYDRRDVLTSPLCHTLSKNTQVCIKSFLQRVDSKISYVDLEHIIKECSDKFKDVIPEKSEELCSPLMGILKTPVSKASKFQDKDREITKLKNMLDMERYEKTDLQEELKLQNEKIKKIESSLSKSNTDIVRLKREITALESRTPPHFRAIDPIDTEKRLKKEIQSLEHYIEKSEKEQDELREETYRNRKKLKEWETEYASLHAKCLENEKKVEHLSQLSEKQASKITSLETYCEELNGLLEELQAKPANESSMFETSTVNYRRSLNLAEENLACSVVEVQLKDAQQQNMEMVMKIDSLSDELENNKKILHLKENEYVAKFNQLREYTKKFEDIKVNVNDMKHYYEKETKEYINYLKDIKHKFITIVVKNYEKYIERLSNQLIREKEVSQSISSELADTLSNFEKCKKELEEATNVNKHFVENTAQLEKSVADLVKQKEILSSKLNNSEERNEKCLNEIDSLKSDEVKYKYEIDQLENEKRNFLSEIQSMEDCHHILKGRNEDLLSKLTISEETNKEFVARITLSEETIENLKKELNQAVSDRSECVNKFEMLRNDFKQLNFQNEDISTKLVSAIKSNAESITRIQFLEEDIEQKRNELDKVMSEKSECASELETSVQNYQKVSKLAEDLSLRLAILEETIEEKNNQFNKVTSENNEYIKQMNNIKKDLEGMTESVLELSSKNKEQSNELIELQSTEGKYMHIIKMIASYNQELNKVLKNVGRQPPAVEISDCQETGSSLKISSELNTGEKSLGGEEFNEISYLGKQISEINHYINFYHEREKFYLNEHDNLKGELATIKNNYQKLSKENKDLILKLDDSEKMTEEHTTKIEYLEEAIKQNKDELNKLISEKDKFSTQKNIIKNDYEELTKRALQLSSENEYKDKILMEKKDDYINLIKGINIYNQELNNVVSNLKIQRCILENSDSHEADSSSNIPCELNNIEKNEDDQKLDELSQLGKLISEINSHFKFYSDRENFYLQEKDGFMEELAKSKNNHQALTELNEDLNLKLVNSEEMIKEYSSKVKNLEEAIKVNNEELSKVISEKDNYITQINDIKNDHELLTTKAHQLSLENEEKDTFLIKKEGDYINLIKTITIYNEALNKVVNDLKIQLVTEKSDNNKTDGSLNISSEFSTTEKSEQSQNFDEISQLGKLISEINNYIRLYSERENIYLNEKTSLEGELATSKNNSQKLAQIIEDLTSKFAVSEKTIGECTTRIKLLEGNIEQKNDELKEVVLEKDKYITRINNEKKLVEDEYINLIKTIAMYNEQLNKVVRNLKGRRAVTEMTDLQRAYNSFNTLSVLNSPERCKIDEKTDEINQLGEQISKINAYIHLYSEKETFYLNEIDSLKGELATTSSNHFELTQNLKDQNCDNESMITSLTENLHSVIEKYNELQVEHRDYLNKISQYQAEITKLKKTYSEVTVTRELKITNLQDEILKLEGEILSLKNIYGKETESYELKVKLLQDKLTGSDEEIYLLKREIEKATIEYDIKVNPLKEKNSQLELEKRVLEEELQCLKAEYAAEVEILRGSISNNEEHINALKIQCDDYETKMSTLQVQIALGKEELVQFKKRSGRTEEEYQSTLANLQVQVVGSRLEITKLTNKVEALLVENEDLQRRIKALEEEMSKEIEKRKTVSDELEKEHEVIMCLRNELGEKEVFLKDVKMLEDLQAKCEKLQLESSDKKFLEEKQVELQQKIETLMKSNETQKETYEIFKIYFKEFRENLDKILSQKNILETLTNNLRVLIVSINKNVPFENLNLKTLFEKKEAMEVIAEDIMKQYNRCTKQTNEIVFDVLKYYERTCDDLLTTFDIKIENYSEKYNLVELSDQISDLTERTADALEQVKILQRDLENLGKVEDVKIQKENILGASRKINVDKMKDDEFKKKNLALRQKVTLLENAKGNLEKTVKKLREENRKIKEGTDKTSPSNDAHYNMLLQEYVAYKEKHDDILKEYKTKLAQLQKEYEELKNVCMRTSTPLGDEPELPTKVEKRLQADLASLREAYSSIRSIKAKLETENGYSKKLIEEQKQEIGKFNLMKEAYEKLLEENSKLMSDVDTMKYKRTRDRDEFLRLLKKERSENDSRNACLIQEIRADYEAKLEKMKEKMIKLYREEVNKEMSKVKAGQHESSSLLKIIEQLKGDLFEAEQKVQVLQAEREILRRNRDQSSLHASRESFSSFQLHDSDTLSLRDFPATSSVGSSSAVAKSRALSAVAMPSEFKHPNAAKGANLDARRQTEVRRVSTLPRTGTVVEEVTVTRRTSFGVTDSIGPNLHMEDEEEMFNNKYLADLKQGKCDLPPTDDRDSRMSELAWRNSLVPPHLKSSYPAEMQFFSPGRFKDDDIKAGNLPFDDSLSKLLPGEKSRKKDFGTTSYKKPGPPTPSKNGGRLSLQGNEVHPAREPPTEPKKSTPSRIRALFTGRNSSKSGAEVSPPKRRLNIFRR